jgi:hypothetical protein
MHPDTTRHTQKSRQQLADLQYNDGASKGMDQMETSRARQMILDDLVREILPVDPAEMSSAEAWEVCYVNMAEFTKVFSASLRHD